MRTEADYYAKLDERIAFVVEGAEETRRSFPEDPRPFADDLAALVAQDWIDRMGRKPGAMMAPWLTVRGIKFPKKDIGGYSIEFRFEKMVRADAIPRLRALPQYRMAALLGEF